MALSFTPKFANMVRVTTSTQGTGPFVCGPAVTGYASFADSVSVGDSFYYSVQGLDRPQEREVGRGTYNANGTITRQALSGALTSFSSGTKTIALVAAAEWYAAVQESLGQGGESGFVLDRAALAARPTVGTGACLLKEAGREGIFAWDATIPVAVHQSDPGQGIFIAPNAAASGAWVRRWSGGVNVRWFGAKGDGVADDGAAFTRALACLRTLAQQGFGYGWGTNRLYVPRGQYFLGTTTLDLTVSTVVEGDSNGLPSGGASVLRWAANATGIRVQGSATSGAEGTKPTDYVTGTSLIRGLHLIGGHVRGTTAEGEFHGVHMRAMAAIEDCFIRGFQGDGIHIRGDVNVSNNTNLAFVSRTTVELCRNGVFLSGGDANACTFLHVNCNSNRRWGFLDNSFLGNSFFGCHSATNGNEPTLSATICPPNRVIRSGRIYAVVHGQEAWCSTNPPSGAATHNLGWYYVAPGVVNAAANIEEWVSGRSYRSGGSYAAVEAGLNARSVFIGCYSEGDMAPNQILPRSLLMGGLHENGTVGSGPFLWTSYDGFYVGNTRLVAPKGARVSSSADLGTALQIGADDEAFTEFHVRGSNYAGGTYYVAGLPQARIFTDGSALRIDVRDKSLKLDAASGAIGEVKASGFDLAAGKSFQINGQQVVGARRGGWTAATGNASRGSFAASAAGTASAGYVQSEAQEKRDRIAALEARLIALEGDCRAHGLIN